MSLNLTDAERGHEGERAQESKAKEAIQQLKFEVANLQRLAAEDVAGARSAADQAALDDLQAQKAAIAADRDAKVQARATLPIERTVVGRQPDAGSVDAVEQPPRSDPAASIGVSIDAFVVARAEFCRTIQARRTRSRHSTRPWQSTSGSPYRRHAA